MSFLFIFLPLFFFFFFFNDPATTEIYTLSLHDALPILTTSAVTSLSLDPLLLLVCFEQRSRTLAVVRASGRFAVNILRDREDRKSTRLNSSHVEISYAVFCLKKKKKKKKETIS